ncbi:MAG TPA: TlpA disulfide reductase family protein [Casimicrobiaceae bacterium]|nr:TlpA disulfide reductase family protein [Casimicrobiaceae bacterium]
MRLLLAFLLAGLTCAASTHAANPGTPAPPFALSTASGETVALAALRGRVVYVDFWASWCTPCRRSFPWMNAMQARYAGEGLTVVGVNVDKRRVDAQRFLRDTPASFTVAYDAEGTTPSAYDVRGMPSSYLIDRQGNIAAVEEGFHDERRAALEARIRALLAQH